MSHSDRQALRRRLADLGVEYASLCAELSASCGETVIPGLFLVVEVSGSSVLVPASFVVEVVRLVACEPITGAPAHVLGSFLYRGAPFVAVDLARLLGSDREPSIDAHMLLLHASRDVGLVVDRVCSLTSEPVATDWSGATGDPGRWAASDLVSGLLRCGDSTFPLLNVGRVLERVAATGASGI